MDSNDLKRERGITIYLKTCSVVYKDLPTLHGIAKERIVKYELEDDGKDLTLLIEFIINYVGEYPQELNQNSTCLQISSLNYDHSFTG